MADVQPLKTLRYEPGVAGPLEDLGFFCIDNLPPSLIETFLNLYRQSEAPTRGVAVVSDVRSGELFDHRRTIRLLQNDDVRLARRDARGWVDQGDRGRGVRAGRCWGSRR